MSRVQALLENKEVQTFLENNEESLQEAEVAIADFPKVLKSFVIDHSNEFIAENLDETYKNIRVFTEVATSQFITEVTSMYGNALIEEEAAVNEEISDYI